MTEGMSYFELPKPRRERCPFCDNVAGRVTERGTRCAVVAETELTLTFVAPRRQHHGRLLVISKRHVATLLDLTDREAAAIMRDTRRAALAVTKAFKPDGLTIYQNNGVGAGHEIPHVHM
ncbi:MAG: HIT domain-containing protein, partial [Chloroflexota bacterium]|nr:HIT domain-containing protein [Chloroflexota bacterium]